ncbi:glutamine-hydrolyzing GMP synthase [Candidatus Peregrinibacteria bacterium]|nr:MAG: glutamine-hydrolyzing GMP synthase [Candidatus Peregrinibacteria bacterium]
MNKIAILDFGSQYTHLLATRVRRLGVYSEILHPADVTAEGLKDYVGIILSGGPASVYEAGSPTVDPAIFTLGKPILGVCYGHQLITSLLGGTVEPGKGVGAEFGKAAITIQKNEGLFAGFAPQEETQVWMSHGDRVTQLPDGFEVFATSKDDGYSAVGDSKRNIYGVQFHGEVVHTVKGNEMLLNFIKLTGVARDWDLGSFVEQSLQQIRTQVGDRSVFMLISGGVDSTVAYVLLAKALGTDRVYGLFVDTGFMRAGERDQVESALRREGINKLHVVDASEEFYAALAGATEPEKKREIIGRVFLEVQARIAQELALDPAHWMLGQGTIYPDTIESGGTKNSAKIKTHHNRVPEIEALIKEGRVIEPLKDLYKDEVREVGEKLGLPTALVWRHPFPGPGLAVRLLCAEAPDWAPNHETLEAQINLFLAQQKAEGKLTNLLTAKTLPIKSVGVQGDFRTYRHPVVLTGEATWQELAQLAPALTNRFHELNRVLYNFGPAPESITLTPGTLTKDRTLRLQEADKLAMLWLKDIGQDRAVWQMPTVLLPVSVNAENKESLVLRPIVSEEAMTAHFSELPMDKIRELTTELLKDDQISAVFYDITNKPPATIEWE